MGYLNEWLRKLRSGEQLPKKNHLLLILLAGILLLVVTFPDVRSKPSADESEDGSASVMNENTDLQKYADDLEKEIAGILSRVEGVGEVEVMITLKSGNRKIVEKDERSTRDDAAEETSVYRQNADGSSEPYVNTELSPGIEGVAVIAEGGGSPVVRQEITEAVQALFDVEAHKIKIMKHA
ncbi:MAG TPA: stage III sporulation protein AG [Candidatus Mediterraneibacter guildfordensis]|nr:stage III sporulation protein AG [Candidatus Mediterraneibacter guildfordensis]